MTCHWNAILIPYNSIRKLAAKKLVSKRGNPITILSGTVLIKSIVLELKQKVSDPIILVSNLLTHFDIDENGDNVVKEFSPIHIFQVSDTYMTKIVHIEKPMCIDFCEVDEMTFQLMTLNKTKVDIPFSVHLYYKLN